MIILIKVFFYYFLHLYTFCYEAGSLLIQGRWVLCYHISASLLSLMTEAKAEDSHDTKHPWSHFFLYPLPEFSFQATRATNIIRPNLRVQ